MSKIPYIIIGSAVILAALLFVGCRKKDPPSTDNIDGGVRTNRTDPDAPKSITSSEITSFGCVFSTAALIDAPEFEGRVYELEAKVKDGRVHGYFDRYNRSGEGNKTAFETDMCFMESLYGIVSKYDLAKYNGYSYSVSGLPAMYGAGINIDFASGENIYASDNQSNFLPLDAMRELVALFDSVSAKNGGAVWQSMTISRSHSVWNRCFNISVSADSSGGMTAKGYCNDPDGSEHTSEEGFVISDESVTALRMLELDGLTDKKKKPDFGFQVMDETVQKLILTYADGRETEKELSDDTLTKVLDILLEEFKTQ